MVRAKDLTGQRFSRWLVIERGEDYIYPSTGKGAVRWFCECDCGNRALVHAAHLNNGTSQSCGSLNREISSVHGLSGTRAYKAYAHMVRRCSGLYEKDNPYYKDKGIGVCPRWLESVENFYEDMGECPDGYELERLDYNKGYCPENCIWADEQTQSENRGEYSNNTSGRTGVTWSEVHGKWRVYLYHKKKKYEGGLHSSFERAVEVRESLELKYLGYIKHKEK